MLINHNRNENILQSSYQLWSCIFVAGFSWFEWSSSHTSIPSIFPRQTSNFPPHACTCSNSTFPCAHVLRAGSSHGIYKSRKDLLKCLFINLHDRCCICHVSHHLREHLRPLPVAPCLHSNHPLSHPLLPSPHIHQS